MLNQLHHILRRITHCLSKPAFGLVYFFYEQIIDCLSDSGITEIYIKLDFGMVLLNVLL